IDETNRHARTPLFLACDKGHVETARLFFQKGATVNLSDDWGRTPRNLAESPSSAQSPQTRKSRQEFVQLLLAHNADPNLKDSKGHAALDYAREGAQPALVELLKPVTGGAAEIQGAFGVKLGATFEPSNGKPITGGKLEGDQLTPEILLNGQ